MSSGHGPKRRTKRPSIQEKQLERNCCICHVKLLKKSVSDHYPVDFLGKGRVFKIESLVRVFYPTIYIIIRLLG